MIKYILQAANQSHFVVSYLIKAVRAYYQYLVSYFGSIIISVSLYNSEQKIGIHVDISIHEDAPYSVKIAYVSFDSYGTFDRVGRVIVDGNDYSVVKIGIPIK